MSTQPNPELKPCPFCGSIRIVKGERYFAMCVDCGATGPERNADATARKYYGDWNTRTTPQPQKHQWTAEGLWKEFGGDPTQWHIMHDDIKEQWQRLANAINNRK